MKKFFYIALIFLLQTSLCFAIVENKNISLKDAIDITLKNNPDVQIEKLEVEIQKNKIKSSNALLNPTLGTFQNIGDSGRGNPQQIGMDVVVEVLKRSKRKKYAKSNHRASQNKEEHLKQLLIYNVKKAYLDLLLAKTNYKILTEQKKLAQELLSNLEESYKQNKTPKTQIIEAKISLNRLILYMNIAKSEVVFSQNRFNSILNTKEFNYDTKEQMLSENYSDLFAFSPLDFEINFERIKNYALNNRQDLKNAYENIQMAQHYLAIEKSKLIPDLQVAGGWGYITKGMSEYERFQTGAFAEVNLVNLPLFYQYKPEIQNAKLQIEQAKLRYEDIKIDVIRDLTDAYERYTIAKDNLNYYNSELLVNSKELLDESLKSLKNNEIELTTFLVSKKLSLELILGYYQALGEYYMSCAELIKETGIQDFDEFINL